jgi:hypothetical protein
MLRVDQLLRPVTVQIMVLMNRNGGRIAPYIQVYGAYRVFIQHRGVLYSPAPIPTHAPHHENLLHAIRAGTQSSAKHLPELHRCLQLSTVTILTVGTHKLVVGWSLHTWVCGAVRVWLPLR